MTTRFFIVYRSGRTNTVTIEDEDKARNFEYKKLRYNEKVAHYNKVIAKTASSLPRA